MFLEVVAGIFSCGACWQVSRRSFPLGLDNGVENPPLGWNTWKTCVSDTCEHDVCNEGSDQTKSHMP